MPRIAIRALAGVALVALIVGGALLLFTGGESDDEGSPAATDLALAERFGIELRFDEQAPFGGPHPEIADASAPSLAERSCLVISPAPDGSGRVMTLPPGGALIEASPDAPAVARLRRFEETSFPISVGEVPAGKRGVIEIPVDESSRPWQLEIESEAMMSVCGRGAPR